MTMMAEHALIYASAGALVFPLHTPNLDGSCDCREATCDSPGKHPRTLNGFTGATTDAEQIASWWRMWPTANIGLRPNPGQFVLDVDCRAGGHVQLVAMQQRYGRLPDTLTSVTGNGWHVWLSGTAERTVQKLAPGLDIKSHRAGYVVAPPSLHWEGLRYQWSRRLPIAVAPPWLTQLVQRTDLTPAHTGEVGEATPAQLAGWEEFLRGATAGVDRNRRLYWVACRVHEHGADVNPFVDIAVGLGLDWASAAATAASAADPPPRMVTDRLRLVGAA